MGQTESSCSGCLGGLNLLGHFLLHPPSGILHHLSLLTWELAFPHAAHSNSSS